jgi:hypothetical protein
MSKVAKYNIERKAVYCIQVFSGFEFFFCSQKESMLALVVESGAKC